MELTVECQKRPEGSNPRALRRQGIIPATLYGHKGAESISLMLDEKEAKLLLKKASVNNTLIDLNIPDLPWSGKALIREVQAHPWKRNLYHLSFFSVGTHKGVEVAVPIKIVGEAVGVKLQGGVLEEIITELKVQCSPDRIPESIDINVSDLGIGKNLHASDLILPEGVSAIDPPETTILSIVAPAKTTVSADEEAAS